MTLKTAIVSTDSLVAGMSLAEPALRGQAIVYPKGTFLNTDIIRQLKAWDIPQVTVFLKPGQQVPPVSREAVETARALLAEPEPQPDPLQHSLPQQRARQQQGKLPYDRYAQADPQQFATARQLQESGNTPPPEIKEDGGVLVVRGNLGTAYGNLHSPLPIKIAGSIHAGVKVSSDKAIAVVGNITGAMVEAAGSITAKNTVQSVLISKTTISLESAFDSIIDGREKIQVTTGSGTIVGGRLVSGGQIIGKRLGNMEKAETEFIITNELPRIRYQQLLQIETIIKKLQDELAQLQKVLQMIQTLGQKITALPPEKKAQIKQQSDLFFTKQKQYQAALQRKNLIEHEMLELSADDYCPVRATEMALAGIRLCLDGSELLLDKLVNHAGFYKKGTNITIKIIR